MAILTYREALNRAMCEEMDKDPNIFLMGEEVGTTMELIKSPKECFLNTEKKES